MNLQPQMVIVAETPALADDLRAWLVAEGYRPTVETTFASAKVRLRTHPHLVITQLRLGAYNGLHVALHARCEGVPAVVIGEPDTGFERYAKQLGAAYVRINELGRERMLALVRDMIPSACADRHDNGGSAWTDSPSVAAS